jgi:hypothetical protein
MVALLCSMHKIPWKTVGLVVGLVLATLWVVNNINPLGIKQIINPPPSA